MLSEPDGAVICVADTVAAAVGKAYDAEGQGTEWIHEELLDEVQSKPAAATCTGGGVANGSGQGVRGCRVTVPFLFIDHRKHGRSSLFSKPLDVARAEHMWRYRGTGGTSREPVSFPKVFDEPMDYLQWWLAVADQWELRELANSNMGTDPIRHDCLAAMKHYYQHLEARPRPGGVLGFLHFMRQYLDKTWVDKGW